MRIEYDPNKDLTNQEKHGISLVFALELEWDEALVWIDERSDYGEMRMMALAPETATLYYVAFVDRGQGRGAVRRIISLRRANRREVKYYVENI